MVYFLFDAFTLIAHYLMVVGIWAVAYQLARIADKLWTAKN